VLVKDVAARVGKILGAVIGLPVTLFGWAVGEKDVYGDLLYSNTTPIHWLDRVCVVTKIFTTSKGVSLHSPPSDWASCYIVRLGGW